MFYVHRSFFLKIIACMLHLLRVFLREFFKIDILFCLPVRLKLCQFTFLFRLEDTQFRSKNKTWFIKYSLKKNRVFAQNKLDKNNSHPVFSVQNLAPLLCDLCSQSTQTSCLEIPELNGLYYTTESKYELVYKYKKTLLI